MEESRPLFWTPSGCLIFVSIYSDRFLSCLSLAETNQDWIKLAVLARGKRAGPEILSRTGRNQPAICPSPGGLWNQQPRDGCTESEVTRPLGAPGCRDHRGLRVQTPADGWGNPGHGVSLPPGALLICILHSSILLFIHFIHSANMYSMPMRCQAVSRTWGPRGELGAPLSLPSPGREQSCSYPFCLPHL